MEWRQKTELQRREAEEAAHPRDAAETVGEWADRVMGIADSLARNGELSCLELTSFLLGTKYGGFATWLAGERFPKFDSIDGSVRIGLHELESAIAEFQMDREIVGAARTLPPTPTLTLTRTLTH